VNCVQKVNVQDPEAYHRHRAQDGAIPDTPRHGGIRIAEQLADSSRAQSPSDTPASCSDAVGVLGQPLRPQGCHLPSYRRGALSSHRLSRCCPLATCPTYRARTSWSILSILIPSPVSLLPRWSLIERGRQVNRTPAHLRRPGNHGGLTCGCRIPIESMRCHAPLPSSPWGRPLHNSTDSDDLQLSESIYALK
jgi:hypothetical protein